MIKKICKILMIIFMVAGLCIAISNLLPVELNAIRSTEAYDYGLDDCNGPDGSC